MIIKNISPRVVRLTDFPDEKPILPGQQVDLSKYTAAERAQSDELQGFFQRGYLICLGYAPTSKTLPSNQIKKDSLTKYKIEEDEIDLNETLVPAPKMQPINNAPVRRDRLPHPTTAPERYNADALDQYRYEIEYQEDGQIPAFQEKTFETKRSHSFVQVQNEDEVYTMSLDEETGTVFQEGKPGVIPTDFAADESVFLDKRIYTIEETEKANYQKEKIKQNLKKVIEQRVKHKCLFPRADGKPCQRPTVPGFERCYFHLSKEDKAKYIENQKLQREEKRSVD